MRALVVGGSGSGKSAFAEQLACSLSPTRTYLATMANNGTEAQQRIDRHRRQRTDKGFVTFECTHTLHDVLARHAPSSGVLLLDDLGNLVANALFHADGTMADPTCVLECLTTEVQELVKAYEHVVVVGNEVGSQGPYASEETNAWIRLLGTLCCRIAAEFDTVVEVAAGIPLVIRGYSLASKGYSPSDDATTRGHSPGCGFGDPPGR